MTRFLTGLAVSLIFCGAAAAQYTNTLDGGVTQIVDSVWDAGGDVRIGTTTSSNRFEVTTGGNVTAVDTYIGEFNAANNTLSIEGTNAQWTGETIVVGLNGSDNTLQVLDSATLDVDSITVGGNAGASSNVVYFSGDYTTVSIQSNLVVGAASEGNSGVLSGGAAVTAENVVVGAASTAASNTLTVTGSDTALNLTGDLTVGDAGRGNSLVVTTSAAVTNDNSNVGVSSDYNYARVTGSGEWVTLNDFQLGAAGNSGNVVVVDSGGVISVGDLLLEGSSNLFYLADGGTLAIDNDFNASSSGLVWQAGGHLKVTGEVTDLQTTNGVAHLSDGRELTIDGGTYAEPSTNLVIGYDAGGSTLVITNGATVENADGFIGWGGSSGTNRVVVTGSGSAWRNRDNLYVGTTLDGTNLHSTASDNSLAVTNGGVVYVGEAAAADVGAGTAEGIIVGSTNGAVLMAGSDSTIETDGTLYLGGDTDLTIIGSATVQTGATIQVADLVINNDDSSFNLNNEGTLIVTGDYDVDAAGDRFNWNDGGALEVQGALTLDDGLEGDSRILSVSGSNASWVVSGPLAAGSNGVVYIENGAAVTNTTGVVLAGATNQVVIQDSGSQLISQGILTASGSTNRMTVQDGGLVVADGLNFSGDNFFYLKSDGTLSITNDFNWLATSNLSWQSGGILQVQGALTGMETATNTVNGTSNIVATVIDGGRDLTLNGGSLTVAADDLIVGYEDSNSNVRFTNGTAVVNRDGYIGWGSSSANNSVTVSGSGSVWHNTGGDLYIGAYWEDGTNLAATGSGNSLTVSDGGRVFVGEATNNVDGLLVASTNGATFTVWKGQGFIDDTLTIGLSSNVYGTVTITNGGDLSVGDLVINEDSLLELETGGTFRIATNFNQHYWEQNGFAWTSSNSTLQVGGELTRTNYYLDNGQDLILDGSNAVWTVAGQDLEIGRDGASVLTLSDGASLTNVNTYVGAAANTNNGSHGIYLLDGASWKSTGNLWIGSTSSNNFVEIYSQSQAEIDGSVYVGGESSGNYLLVSGSNSLMTIGGDLEIGNGSTNSTSNALELSNLARLHVTGDVVINAGNGILMSGSTTNRVGGDYTVRSNATVTGTGTVEFDDAFASLIFEDGNSFMQDDDLAVSDGIIFEGGGNNMLEVTGGTFFVDGSNSNQYRNFQTLELTDASIMGYGTNDAFSAVNISGGTIRPATYLSTNSVSAGTLVIDGATSLSDVTYEAQLLGVNGTDLLHFTDDVDIGDMLIAVYVANATNATNVVMTTDGTMSNTFKSNTVVNGMLLWDADVVKVGDEIQVVLTNNTEKFSSSLDYAGTESVRSGFSGMKNSVFTRTKQLRRNLVSTAHSMPHEAFLMTNTNSPSGPEGPGADNTIFDMHIWAQYFSGQGDYDAHGNSYGYTLNNSGTTLGADKLIGEALAVGFNYTYARGDARTSNDDYLDTETYWLGAYAEWVNRDGLFLDGLLAYGRSNYESVRVEKDDDLDYEGVADYRGDTFGAYLDVGQYMYYKNFSLAPYAGLHMLFITTEDHVETNESNDSGSRITVHGINRSIVESALGLKARHRFDTNLGRFQTTAFAEWTHDFVQDEIASTLEPDSVAGLRSAPVTMSAIKPEDDMFTIGLGLSWRNTEYMEIGVGYNGRYSDDYEEHTGSLMLDIMF